MGSLTVMETYCQENNIPFRQMAKLAEFCTFRIGGPADLVIQPDCVDQIAGLCAVAKRESIPYIVLGRGSNVLFSDAGYRGAVVHIGSNFSRIRLVDKNMVDCESGCSLMQLCQFAWEHGLSGLEFAYGIPGSVGGAIYMNAGAYGGEMKDVLASTCHVEPNGVSGALIGDEMQFSYRHSAYTGDERIITGGRFRLRLDEPNAIRERMDDYMNRRRQKQPLEYPSAGSTFKRPAGAYASALIDQCGLKGRRVGGAVVSEKHAGFIVNTGGATCDDVLALIQVVRETVREQTGYTLECEVKMIS